ncbi:MAG: aminotransferase class I/II-fold pyridoxal phosphate-dependent enzyme [Lachnospiraceae bacterium]|nr:aminotransferase class I/II-fold pyridoxal phosphate-dependent enzyme [Lachnospiraceae bacterium]
MGTLYKRLMEYGDSDYYPFHMPGHKRNCLSETNPYAYDITEIDGFDNLHEPEGILRIAMDEAANLYGTNKTYFMVNGSSGGILAAIWSCVNRKGKILVARNCHKSVFNAVYLKELTPIYLCPEYVDEFGINGGINPLDVERELNENNDVQAVIITSPTYEGIVSDVKSIADIVHKRRIPLIVDEAHGAHFSMHEELPESAIIQGADIVIQSMHKTLPALTQTALLHLNGKIVSSDAVEKCLRIFQTSSPSYVLMASMDECFNKLQSEGVSMFDIYIKRMNAIYSHCEGLTHLKVLNRKVVGSHAVYDFDISKLVISAKGTGYSGNMLYKELTDKFHLQPEMAAGDYVIAMTSIMDSKEGLLRLFKALVEIDRDIRVYGLKSFFINHNDYHIEKPVVIKTISEVDGCSKETVKLDNSAGKISAEYLYLYPPGIPILAPGELITGEILGVIRKYRESGLNIHGLEDRTGNMINVLKEEFKVWNFGKV